MTAYTGALASLTDKDRHILDLHKQGKALGTIAPEMLELAVIKLMADISVVTGWVVPGGKSQDALITQLTLKINEDYRHLTPAEIMYAFRHNTVENWGKPFNLKTFDEVLVPFIELRADLRINVQHQRAFLPANLSQAAIEYKPDPRKTRWEARKTFNFWKNEVLIENVKIDYIMSFVYDTVLSHGEVCITPFGMEKCLYRAKALILGRASRELATIPSSEGEPVKTGLFAQLTGLIEKLRGQPEDWQYIDEVQKYAKAFFVVGHYRGECGITADRSKKITATELAEMERHGICPLCKKYFQDMGKHFTNDHKEYEPLTTQDNEFRETVFPYVKKNV